MARPRQTKPLGEFLVSLSEDPASLGAYDKDPEGFLAGAGLKKAHRDALLAGDVRKIRKLIEQEQGAVSPGGARPMFIIVYRRANY
jgi:hypothetical protein